MKLCSCYMRARLTVKISNSIQKTYCAVPQQLWLPYTLTTVWCKHISRCSLADLLQKTGKRTFILFLITGAPANNKINISKYKFHTKTWNHEAVHYVWRITTFLSNLLHVSWPRWYALLLISCKKSEVGDSYLCMCTWYTVISSISKCFVLCNLQIHCQWCCWH